jgi:hypothetical protein
MGDNADHNVTIGKHSSPFLRRTKASRPYADTAKWRSFLYSTFQAYGQNGNVLLVSNLSAIVMHAILIPTITQFWEQEQYACETVARNRAALQKRADGDGGHQRNVIFRRWLVQSILH